jgi:hypothetical protein
VCVQCRPTAESILTRELMLRIGKLRVGLSGLELAQQRLGLFLQMFEIGTKR